jgi:predicted HAD superfamily Cof-like phosphohydrolase
MYIEKVSEFHTLFEQPILSKPTIPSKDRCDLRCSLIEEELKELKKAIVDGNIVEVLDALGDIQYVLSGAILEFGMKDIFDDAFTAIHDSNMSKACKTLQEVSDTQAYYLKTDNVETYFVERGDVWFVYRKHDKKLLKSVNYNAVDLKHFI